MVVSLPAPSNPVNNRLFGVTEGGVPVRRRVGDSPSWILKRCWLMNTDRRVKLPTRSGCPILRFVRNTTGIVAAQ